MDGMTGLLERSKRLIGWTHDDEIRDGRLAVDAFDDAGHTDFVVQTERGIYRALTDDEGSQHHYSFGACYYVRRLKRPLLLDGDYLDSHVSHVGLAEIDGGATMILFDERGNGCNEQAVTAIWVS